MGWTGRRKRHSLAALGDLAATDLAKLCWPAPTTSQLDPAMLLLCCTVAACVHDTLCGSDLAPALHCAGTVIPPGAEPSRNIMLALCTFAGCLPVALFGACRCCVQCAQWLSACICALLPRPHTSPAISASSSAVKSAQLLNAVNNVSMAFLLLFCAVIALLPFSPTPGSGTPVAAVASRTSVATCPRCSLAVAPDLPSAVPCS